MATPWNVKARSKSGPRPWGRRVNSPKPKHLLRTVLDVGLVGFAWFEEEELADGDVKAVAVVAHHAVGARHGSLGGREGTEARVFELFSWLDARLLAHDAGTAHFPGVSPAIADDPMAVEQLGGRRTFVGDADRVSEHAYSSDGVRLLGKELGEHTDANSVRGQVGGKFSHAWSCEHHRIG